MPTPEELARQNIDALLKQCGWIIQKRCEINFSAGRDVAITEGLLKGNDEVDYLLFVDGKYGKGLLETEITKAGRRCFVWDRNTDAAGCDPCEETGCALCALNEASPMRRVSASALLVAP